MIMVTFWLSHFVWKLIFVQREIISFCTVMTTLHISLRRLRVYFEIESNLGLKLRMGQTFCEYFNLWNWLKTLRFYVEKPTKWAFVTKINSLAPPIMQEAVFCFYLFFGHISPSCGLRFGFNTLIISSNSQQILSLLVALFCVKIIMSRDLIEILPYWYDISFSTRQD